MEYNLVEIWLRRDPVRWLSGAFAGLLAGVAAMACGMLISSSLGMDLWFPQKVMGTILLGPSATEYSSSSGMMAGVAVIEALGLFWGIIFAHFTGTNSMKALLPMGVVWGIFTWIFNWNLFLKSFKSISAIQIQSGAVFPVCIVFGVTMASVAIFDSLMRSKR